MKVINNNPTYYLIAVDGSEDSQAAIDLLNDLASNTAKITILTVLDTPHSLRRQLLLEALQQSQAVLQKYDRDVLYGMLHGNPSTAVCDYADKHKPDLIILGARGRRATLGILLGGVAQQVIEYSQQPVLIVRPPYKDLKRIMVVSDGSVSSENAIKFLSVMSIVPKPEVHLIHVINPLPSFDTMQPPRTWLFGNDIFQTPLYPEEVGENWREEADLHGKEILASSRNLLLSVGVDPIEKLLSGDAATEILAYAQRQDISLIVSGSRGLNQIKGWLMGSVSRKLVHYATCSVLVVKSNSPSG